MLIASWNPIAAVLLEFFITLLSVWPQECELLESQKLASLLTPITSTTVTCSVEQALRTFRRERGRRMCASRLDVFYRPGLLWFCFAYALQKFCVAQVVFTLFNRKPDLRKVQWSLQNHMANRWWVRERLFHRTVMSPWTVDRKDALILEFLEMT